MQFEHLVEINSATLSTLPPLSRRQLWRGLTIRAERPELFVLGLDSAEIVERDAQHLRRRLSFGNYSVTDRVRLIDMDSVIYDVDPTDTSPASTLVMRIEEPEAGRLFVRFTYTNRLAPGQAEVDDFVQAHLKQAYTQADIDTIKVIRDLASQGLLDAQ